MRLVCISDTHGQHSGVVIPDCDVLIHAGDFMYLGTRRNELTDFNKWLALQPAKHIVCIAGNHDLLLEGRRDEALALLTKPTYLENSGVTIEGIKFWGSPVTPEFYGWAFNVERFDAIRRYWDMIPDDVDVLITHGPPNGILDRVYQSGDHLGCEELRKAVAAKKPKLHIFGHIHTGHGTVESDGTTFINASLLDEAYKRVYEATVIEVMNR